MGVSTAEPDLGFSDILEAKEEDLRGAVAGRGGGAVPVGGNASEMGD